jgi:hypothetical protein
MNKQYIIIMAIVALVIIAVWYIKKNGVPQLFPQSGPQLTVIPGGASTASLDNISQTLTQYVSTSGNNKPSG